MRDRRDYVIAALAAALLFVVGIWIGQGSLLPAVHAQGGTADKGFDPEQPVDGPQIPAGANPGGGITLKPNLSIRPQGMEGRTTSVTASDSDSNNRFVAVTCPIGSGESVLFVLDSKAEQLTVYQYVRRKGLKFVAGRKIDYDLRISGYEDKSEFTRDEMRRLYEKQIAKAHAKATKSK